MIIMISEQVNSSGAFHIIDRDGVDLVDGHVDGHVDKVDQTRQVMDDIRDVTHRYNLLGEVRYVNHHA